MTAHMPYDERFIHFVVLFNVDEDYYECHEVMEELWLEEGRNLLYQGLLQAAVGLHHWRNDNYSGAVKLFTQAENKLAHYPDHAMGLDLERLRADIARSLHPLLAYMEGAASQDTDGSVGGGAGKASPPPFRAFRLAVVDEGLRLLVEEMARIPLEQRLHGEG